MFAKVIVDVMFVGSRGWGPPRRVMAGSTARHLAHDAACPVLVSPRGASTGASEDEPSTAGASA